MTDRALQIEYLRAMGVDVWVLRDSEVPEAAAPHPPERPAAAAAPEAATSGGFVIGPGESHLLLVCEFPGDSGLPIAADIARTLGEAPVWGWPAPAGDDQALPLETVIRERLFTGVLMFGRPSGAAEESAVSGSARIVRAPSLGALADSAEARRGLWETLRETGWCAVRGRAS